MQQPEKIVEAQAAAPAPMTIGTPDTVKNYGNVKFTTAKQDKASDFAEKYLGMGGTYNMWKIIAIAIMIFGFLYLIGTFELGGWDNLGLDKTHLDNTGQ